MPINEQQISSIVDRVVDQLTATAASPQSTDSNVSQAISQKIEAKSKNSDCRPQTGSRITGFIADFRDSETLGCFSDIETAITAAVKAFAEYQTISVAQRQEIIQAIREICLENLPTIAKLAVEDTGLGRYTDKLKKNKLAINKTPGIEDLQPIIFTGDDGLTILERAPYGVIGSITPCTNPSETIISNTIGMIAGGNAVAFNPHPSAKQISVLTVSLINKAIISAGGPPNLITTTINPTIQSAKTLMQHSKINLLVVTGGPAVVATAMKSGKKVIAAGPGNPPVVVDETADLDKAAHDIVSSASTDNNIICLIEKNIVAVKTIADELKKALVRHGAVELNSYQAKHLEQIIVEDDHPSKQWVGKDIQLILKQIGMEVDATKRLAITETNAEHPFARLELLMPVIPFIRANNVDEAIEIAYQLEDGCFHTAVMHSKNIDNLHKMAVKMNTSIFVKNGPALAGLGIGGEGPASFTIASPTGEGVTTARHFTRVRRCVLSGHFRIV